MSRQKSFLLTLFAVTLLLALSSDAGAVPAVTQEKVLYPFNGGEDGQWPSSNLIFDAAGNLYGTTYGGGDFVCDRNFGCGTVFELELGTNGQWTKRIIHVFSGPDGAFPYGSLVFDNSGNLYGTTIAGGDPDGYGVVFKLTPGANGAWDETLLHVFDDADGALPTSSLIFDGKGNLYGTTQTGGDPSRCGQQGCGTVFRLSPAADGNWTMTVLHAFGGLDGSTPTCPLVFDSAGNLYGTTSSGGAKNYGVVFELQPGTNGKWTETVLHSFSGRDGATPYAGLVFDSAGNLYGTTFDGGDFNNYYCSGTGCGTVFELSPSANGKWVMSVIHAFNGAGGTSPFAGVIFDTAGNLYGTTYSSGGVAFRLSLGGNGKWRETVLHSFTGADGLTPLGGLVFDSVGNLYGTTQDGGNLNNCDSEGTGCGVVFEITR